MFLPPCWGYKYLVLARCFSSSLLLLLYNLLALRLVLLLVIYLPFFFFIYIYIYTALYLYFFIFPPFIFHIYIQLAGRYLFIFYLILLLFRYHISSLPSSPFSLLYQSPSLALYQSLYQGDITFDASFLCFFVFALLDFYIGCFLALCVLLLLYRTFRSIEETRESTTV